VRGGGIEKWHGAGGSGTTKVVVYHTVEGVRRLGEEMGKIVKE
jgi:hypothetical protein